MRFPLRLLILLCLIAPVSGIAQLTINFDYTYDTTGFFSGTAGAVRRADLNAAAQVFENRMTHESFSAITPGGVNTWDLLFANPTTGAAVSLANPVLPANTITIYVGAKNMTGYGTDTLGQSSWGYDYGGYPNTTWMNMFVNRDSNTNFAPFGGSISFNASASWYFDPNPSVQESVPSFPGKFDFFSVVQHELGHILGFTQNSSAFAAMTSGTTFVGAAAEALYGGPVPLSPDLSHFAQGMTSGGGEVAMDPSITAGQRKNFSDLDFSALQSIGYTIDSSSQSSVVRSMPITYTAGSPVQVSLNVISGTGTLSYSVEDVPPAGWTVSNISDPGVWDAISGSVKWGPFSDNISRNLTYSATPPAGTVGVQKFAATASFDGNDVQVTGWDEIYDKTPVAPSMPVNLVATGTVTFPFFYQIPASNNPALYTATGLPDWLSFDSSTGIISGTVQAAGVFTVGITAGNPSGTAFSALALTMRPPVPVITSTLAAIGVYGVPFTYQITATNSPTSFAAVGLPTGWIINAANGTITGTPRAYGNFTIIVEAINAGGMGVASLQLSFTGTSDPTLSGLAVSSGTISPLFSTSTIAYTTSVANSGTGITVTPIAHQPGAAISVCVNSGSYSAVSSGSASGLLPLKVGVNTIGVKVTAADGVTVKSYTVTVTRAKNSNASLSSLSVENGTVTPLSSGTLVSGTVALSGTVVASITRVTATKADDLSNPTIMVRVNGGAFTAAASGSASGALALTKTGANTIDVKVTSEDSTQTLTYRVNAIRVMSSNADLSGLKLSSGTMSPVFASSGTSYTTSVPNTVSSITVTPVKAELDAKIAVRLHLSDTTSYTSVASGVASAPLALKGGDNPIDVQVIAEDGTTTMTYTVTATRLKSSNANLAALAFNGGALAPAFSTTGTGTSYTAKVAFTGTTVTVTPTVAEPNATIAVRVNGGSFITGSSGKASSPLSLNVGANSIDVQVTAQDGSTIKTYTLTATRTGSPDATLSALALSSGTLAQVFKPLILAYGAGVGNDVTSITVTPTVNEPNANVMVRVNGGTFSTVPSGTNSAPLPLKTGANTVEVKVTAQDGVTVKSYLVTVARAKNSNAFLSALTLNGGSFAPVFSSSTLAYGGTVASAIATVTAIKAVDDPNASPTIQVQVNGGAFGTVASGSSSGPLALRFGTAPNLINVKVTSEDGSKTTTYTIAVTRVKSSNADLSGLTLNAGPITPQFTASGTIYSANVANGLGSVTVTPVHSDPSAVIKVRVNGMPLAYSPASSGIASSLLTLISGSNGSANPVEIQVTSEDGTTVKVYTITVNRIALCVTNPATNVGSDSATLNASVDGRASSIVFQYGVTTTYASGTLPVNISGSATLTGLMPATVYHYRVKATTGSISDYGLDQTFTTTQVFPVSPSAVQGGAAPLLSGSAKFLSFGSPAINSNGHAAFQATLTLSGTVVTAVNNSGIWIQGDAGIALVARTGIIVPGVGVLTALGDPVCSVSGQNSDQVAFLGTAGAKQGVWWESGTSGVPTMIAIAQGLAPDATGVATLTKFSSFAQVVLPDNGGVAFLATLGISGTVTTRNNQGIWAVDGTGLLKEVLRTGDVFEGGTVSSLSIFSSSANVAGQTRSFNSSGDFVFMATMTTGTIVRQGVFVLSPSLAILPVKVAIAGDMAPLDSGSASFVTFGNPIIDGTGNAAFQAVVSGSNINATKVNNSGIWAESGTAGTLSMVARIGVPQTYAQVSASGTTVMTGTFAALSDPVFNNSDQVAFLGTLKIGGAGVTAVTAVNSQGIWMTNPLETPVLAVRAQDPAGDCPVGAKFASFSQLVLPDSGRLIILANLTAGTGGVTAANSQGIWAMDTSGRWRLVVRTGDAFVVDGVTKFISALSIFSSSAGTGGQTRSFNAAGDLIYRVTFVGGTQALYRVVVP